MSFYQLPPFPSDGFQQKQKYSANVKAVRLLAGFPSLQTLLFTATLGFHGVNCFGSESKNQSIILTMNTQSMNDSIDAFAREKLGKRAFVGKLQ